MKATHGHKQTSRFSESSTAQAFTLVELLIVITLLGIAVGVALPMIGNSKELRLREAARMLAADLEMAQIESITHADDQRLVKFDMTHHRYWIGTSSAPDVPVMDGVRNEPFVVAFGSGRASELNGVTIQSVSLGGDNVIRFDAFGSPDQSADATVTLACGENTLTVTIEAGTGDVSVE